MKNSIDYQKELLNRVLELEKNGYGNIRDAHFEVQEIFSNYLSVLYESERDQLERLRMLRRTHLLFDEANTLSHTGPVLRYCIRLLEIEIELHNTQMLMYKRPAPTDVHEPEMDMPAALTWNGSISQLLELICALFHSRLIHLSDGSHVPFIQLVHTLENLFRIEIKEPYRRRSTLEQRKRNPTPFLDLLKRRYNECIKADIEISPSDHKQWDGSHR